ncbi:DUF2167 domain-containing protein [Frateuria sp. MAH-13]|uniref:DUF2167 domain-containing protein n=1 Tax=Frateuria flava TaxID=2821489 RepID=A0ABS4DNJ1_9GAMM|nr:DUF2167 domain-containing protein [Frateuria flava]MBP1474611.1 DUF2167 domain-containing protein [Frateuria flava]
MKGIRAAVAGLLLLVAATRSHGQQSPVAELPWQMGPTKVQVGSHATLDVPEGYAFLDAKATERFNELMHNLPDPTPTYTLAPTDLNWVAMFSYEDIGYVQDNEDLDADAILSSVREGTEEGNRERAKRGWAQLHITGWGLKPQYDPQIKSLAWAIRASSSQSDEEVVNYNTRLLGRLGVMDVVVITDADKLTGAVADFKSKLPGFGFVPGETYAEYRSGDRVAEYGLAALITGGAAAVAAKKGLFTVIGGFLAAAWKFVVAGFIALGAWLKSLFKRRQGA